MVYTIKMKVNVHYPRLTRMFNGNGRSAFVFPPRKRPMRGGVVAAGAMKLASAAALAAVASAGLPSLGSFAVLLLALNDKPEWLVLCLYVLVLSNWC